MEGQRNPGALYFSGLLATSGLALGISEPARLSRREMSGSSPSRLSRGCRSRMRSPSERVNDLKTTLHSVGITSERDRLSRRSTAISPNDFHLVND